MSLQLYERIAELEPAGWAATYTLHGLPVLPLHHLDRIEASDPLECTCGRADCHSPGKHPRTRNGKDDATTDPGQIAEWWGRWPDANVGIRPPAGVVVLDVDPRNHGATTLHALTQRHAPLPATLTAWTGGGGLHVWLSYGGRHRGALCPGVDVKGHNGYLVAPPSLHVSGRRYEWGNEAPVARAPGWVQRLLDPPRHTPTDIGHSEPGQASAAGLVRSVAAAAEGNRNRALHWAACRAHERGSDKTLLADLVAAAVSAGLDARQCWLTVESARRTVEGGGATT
ncbi:MAG: DNA primase [Pseudonocardiaceae bacterium]|nr:DNA primase [Pseudonocardiaceae bacterium]